MEAAVREGRRRAEKRHREQVTQRTKRKETTDIQDRGEGLKESPGPGEQGGPRVVGRCRVRPFVCICYGLGVG